MCSKRNGRRCAWWRMIATGQPSNCSSYSFAAQILYAFGGMSTNTSTSLPSWCSLRATEPNTRIEVMPKRSRISVECFCNKSMYSCLVFILQCDFVCFCKDIKYLRITIKSYSFYTIKKETSVYRIPYSSIINDRNRGRQWPFVRRRKAVRVESGSDLSGDEVGAEVGLIRVCTEV